MQIHVVVESDVFGDIGDALNVLDISVDTADIACGDKEFANGDVIEWDKTR